LKFSSLDRRVLFALVWASVLALVLLAVGMVATGSLRTYYLAMNLALAYLPLLVSYPFLQAVHRQGWWRLAPWLWGSAWLLLLPNSFYLLTDIMHLFDQLYGLNPMYALAVFGLFGALGMAIGFLSVLFFHRSISRSAGKLVAYSTVELVFLLSSFGIYLGHVLRVNSWDIILHPVALAQDASAGIVGSTSSDLVLMGTFFVLLSGLYAIFWRSLSVR
jgi:uncharacterized membrane protein